MKYIYLAGSKIGLNDWEEMPWREFVHSEHPYTIDGTEREFPLSKKKTADLRRMDDNSFSRWDTRRIERDIERASAIIGYLDWSWGRPLGGYHLDWELELGKKAGKFVGLVDKRGECRRGNDYWLDRIDMFDEKLYPVVLATLKGIGVTPKPDEWIIS